MGLTFEDLDITEESISVAYIRNRASDKPYQLAKTCMTIVAREQYKQRDYQTRDYGFQEVVISLELYELIDKYIT